MAGNQPYIYIFNRLITHQCGPVVPEHWPHKTVLAGTCFVFLVLFFFNLMAAACRLTLLTSPTEYQRNHVGPGGGGSSVGAPSAGSSVSAAPHGVGSGIQGNAIASGPQQGGSRRPSRIPQPSRLPQPLRHHPGVDPEGPGKMSGTNSALCAPSNVNPAADANHCSFTSYTSMITEMA